MKIITPTAMRVFLMTAPLMPVIEQQTDYSTAGLN
jgi:hypothetical protein